MVAEREDQLPRDHEYDFYGALGEAIRVRRLQHGLSQAALGEKIGYTQPSVFSIEAGHWMLRVHVLLRIAEALDASVCDLIEEALD